MDENDQLQRILIAASTLIDVGLEHFDIEAAHSVLVWIPKGEHTLTYQTTDLDLDKLKEALLLSIEAIDKQLINKSNAVH